MIDYDNYTRFFSVVKSTLPDGCSCLYQLDFQPVDTETWIAICEWFDYNDIKLSVRYCNNAEAWTLWTFDFDSMEDKAKFILRWI